MTLIAGENIRDAITSLGGVPAGWRVELYRSLAENIPDGLGADTNAPDVLNGAALWTSIRGWTSSGTKAGISLGAARTGLPATLVISGERISSNDNAANSSFYRPITLEVGKRYRITSYLVRKPQPITKAYIRITRQSSGNPSTDNTDSGQIIVFSEKVLNPPTLSLKNSVPYSRSFVAEFAEAYFVMTARGFSAGNPTLSFGPTTLEQLD